MAQITPRPEPRGFPVAKLSWAASGARSGHSASASAPTNSFARKRELFPLLKTQEGWTTSRHVLYLALGNRLLRQLWSDWPSFLYRRSEKKPRRGVSSAAGRVRTDYARDPTA